MTYAQTISFITRALVFQGYWQPQPGAAHPYIGVPATHDADVRTFHAYTGGIPYAPTSSTGWNSQATRGWFAMALWQALNSYWGTDAPGRGGYVP